MNNEQWQAFTKFRAEFKAKCQEWNTQFAQALEPLQKEAAKTDTPEYPLETGIVYNKALDELTEQSDIRLIVIGDNPGKDEQLAKNNRYLVGQSGKIAAGFFAKNPEFKTDFRKNAIILNKTPVHTAKTKHIKHLLKNGGESIQKLLHDSQGYMAKKTAELHQKLLSCAKTEQEKPELWLVGYAELKDKGLFMHYKNTLKASYTKENWQNVFVFQHFSMNRFLIDLKEFQEKTCESSKTKAVHALGELHKNEIFGSF